MQGGRPDVLRRAALKRACFAAIATLLVIGTTAMSRSLGVTSATSLPRGPVVDWSLEAQRAIVPPPAGNGNKFPGEAAVYMAIVHAAMYDAAVAVRGGYRPYAIARRISTPTSSAAAISTAAHDVLVALLPTQRGDLDRRHAEYVSKLPADAAKANGIAVGEHIAAGIVALRVNDGRNANPEYVQPSAVMTRPLQMTRSTPLCSSGLRRTGNLAFSASYIGQLRDAIDIVRILHAAQRWP